MSENNVIMMQSALGQGQVKTPAQQIASTLTVSQSKIEAQAVDVALANFTSQCGELTTEYFVGDTSAVDKMVDDIILDVRLSIKMANIANNDKMTAMRANPDLSEAQIVQILSQVREIKVMRSPSGRVRHLVIRVLRGRDAGTYVRQDDDDSTYLYRLIKVLRRNASKAMVNRIRDLLLDECEEIVEDFDSTLVHCQNGTYDLKDGSFLAYCNDDGTPNTTYYDKYDNVVVRNKLTTNYNPDAKLVVIDDNGEDWDIESSIKDLFAGADICDACVKLAWQIIHFAVRGTNGGRGWFLVNMRGSAGGGNGKDTYINIIKGLLGTSKVLTTSFENLDERFALMTLADSLAWLSSESNASTSAAASVINWKQIVRQSEVTIDEKNKSLYTLSWHGMTIQAINDSPKFSEKSDSIYRVVEYLPFESKFTSDGVNRDYIRDDYIRRPEVLEYVLKKVLEFGCLKSYDADALSQIQRIKNEARCTANNVWQMMDGINDDLAGWMQAEIRDEKKPTDYIPLQVLYKFYSDNKDGWAVNQGIRLPQTKQSFNRDISVWCNQHPEWVYVPTSEKKVRWTPVTHRVMPWLTGYKIDGLNAKSNRTGEYIDYLDADLTKPVYAGYIKYVG